MVIPVRSIKHYQINSEIGRGKGATVYHAHDTLNNRDVALKICDSRFFSTDRIEQIKQESAVLAWLNTDNAPKIYDYFQDETYHCLVMEYISGQNLEDVLTQTSNPIPQEMAIEWGIHVCNVLDALHTHPTPHIYRYIKPKNLILNPENQLYLVDFGKVTPFYPDGNYPQTGTIGYAPPEQYIGQPEPRSDIYSLGVLLYHAITKYDPRMPKRAFLFHVRPPHDFKINIKNSFEEVILRAVEHKAQDRFASAAAMRSALIRCRTS